MIETSGVADPTDVVRNLMDPVIWREAPLETVLCVVDTTIPVAMLDDALLRAQVRAADVVALSKVDLADPANYAQVRDAVRAMRPAAVLVDAPHGEISRSAAFSFGRRSCAGAARTGATATGGRSVRDAELVVGTAGVVVAVAAGDRPARAETGAGEGAFRYRGAARQVDGVSVCRRAGDAGTGRDTDSGNAADTHRIRCRDRRAVARRDRRHHGRMHRSWSEVKAHGWAAMSKR